MHWLTSLPSAALVVGWLAVAVVVAVCSRWVVRAFVPADERDHVQSIAAPLMPALGAAFAVLMALTLASEAGYLRSARDTVSDEAAQASRLAWASTSPGVETEPVQTALTQYLRATRAREWTEGVTESGHDDVVGEKLADLERVVRAQAARSEIGTPASTELLASLDAVTMGRRTRLAEGSREIPVLYVFTLVASGVVLVMNAGALTFRSSWRTSLLVGGLSVVVGLSIALLFAISEPWEGPLVVSGRPIDAVVDDLGSGFFHS
jgi:hypothetical protein